MHKTTSGEQSRTIELVKGQDGTYREGKTEPKQALFRQPKRRPPRYSYPAIKTKNPIDQTLKIINDTLEEIGMKALNELTRGFFK